MARMLVIDLDRCRACETCVAKCSYPYHGANDGIARLRETASFEITCRRCEVRSCVTACPKEALELLDSGVLRRWNMRCTGCLSCSQACPFGNIVPAAFQFHDNVCDFCAGRSESEPLCVVTCPYGAVAFEEVAPESKEVHPVGERLAVKGVVWQKKEAAEAK